MRGHVAGYADDRGTLVHSRSIGNITPMGWGGGSLLNAYVWAIIAPLAAVLGFATARFRCRQYGLAPETLDAAVVPAVLLGLVAAHAAEILLYEEAGAGPPFFARVLRFWEALGPGGTGLSSVGGLVGGATGFALVLSLRGALSWRYADVIMQGLVIAWVVVRLGCTLVGDHPGARTEFFLAMQFADGLRHNMGLYEFLFMLLVVVPGNLRLNRTRPPTGVFIGFNCLAYGLGRFALDFLRATDLPAADPHYLGLTLAQYFSIAVATFGAWVLYRVSPLLPFPGTQRTDTGMTNSYPPVGLAKK